MATLAMPGSRLVPAGTVVHVSPKFLGPADLSSCRWQDANTGTPLTFATDAVPLTRKTTSSAPLDKSIFAGVPTIGCSLKNTSDSPADPVAPVAPVAPACPVAPA